jgi:hypothetical protein
MPYTWVRPDDDRRWGFDGDGNQVHMRGDLGANRGAGHGSRKRRLPMHVRANPRNLESVAHPAFPTLESSRREGLTLQLPDERRLARLVVRAIGVAAIAQPTHQRGALWLVSR